MFFFVNSKVSPYEDRKFFFSFTGKSKEDLLKSHESTSTMNRTKRKKRKGRGGGGAGETMGVVEKFAKSITGECRVKKFNCTDGNFKIWT